MHKFSASSGKTYGDFSFPDAAPLVFPALDELAAATGEDAEKQKGRLRRIGNFADNYMDRRAQAKYQGENPDSLLSQGPKPKFTSRYADLNHPASSGHIVSLVTGGKINPPSLGQGGGGLLGLGGGGGRGLLGMRGRRMEGGGGGGLLGLGGRGRMGMGGDRYHNQEPHGYGGYTGGGRGGVMGGDGVAGRGGMGMEGYDNHGQALYQNQNGYGNGQGMGMGGYDNHGQAPYQNHNGYGNGRGMGMGPGAGAGRGGLLGGPGVLLKGVNKLLGKVSHLYS
jgi:hypothetical protein